MTWIALRLCKRVLPGLLIAGSAVGLSLGMATPAWAVKSNAKAHPPRHAAKASAAASQASAPAASAPAQTAEQASALIARLAEDYDKGYYSLFPLAATENNGDAAYEAAFEIDIAPEHRTRQQAFYRDTLKRLNAIDPRVLSRDERITYELLRYEVSDRLSLLAFPSHWLPLNPLDSVPTRLAQWGSGAGAQPLKTVANHEHFLARLGRMPAWVDQAIANMRRGTAQGVVQPKPLMERMLTQLDGLLSDDFTASPFSGAARSFADDISTADRERLSEAYRTLLAKQLAPAMRKLRDYVANDYLPKCRTTAGLGALPQGAGWYRALVKSSTTMSLSPQEIHEIGLHEVTRIRGEMAAVQKRFGFEGTLPAFVASLRERSELRPFHSEAEVLDAYAALNRRIEAALPTLFEQTPKVALEIRAVEPLRRETVSDYYLPPALDGSRPGVFFAVVQDPARYSSTGMTALFLHEGQPGHHYQISMQQALNAPKFRRGGWYDAYGEGWALYAESLGRELGLYDDSNAYLGRLFGELHRAIRLVVDTGLHAKGWSREQAIRYMMETEGSDESDARRATERYMSIPGQALAYKIGELKILELRARARKALGERFDIRAFHTQVLRDGCVPLSMLESNLQAWMAQP